MCILSICLPVTCARRGYPKKNPWLEGTKADINSEVEMKRLHHDTADVEKKSRDMILKLNVLMKQIFSRAAARYKHNASSDSRKGRSFRYQDPLDTEIPFQYITLTINKEKIKAQNASNFITKDVSVTDSMMESKVRLMSETEKLEKKRELMRREGNKTVQTLKQLEKFLSDYVDKKMKEYTEKKEKKSSSDDISKSNWHIPVDALYDFVHESVVDKDGMFKYKEEGSTILDRHGNPLHYTSEQQKEQLSTNFEGKHAHWCDHMCCRTVNRFSTFYQRFWWHCSMWLCIDICVILGGILLMIHVWQKYDTLPSKLVEEGLSGSMTFDF